MARVKRLYRVRWLMPSQYGGEPYPMTRHYQSKAARDRKAEQVARGREEEGGFDWYIDPIPPAVPGSVVCDESEPIIFREGEQ